MSKNRGQFNTLVRAHPPVIGLDTDETDTPPVSGTSGKFHNNIIAFPPVVGVEHLKLRLRVQVPSSGDASALILRAVEAASEMDRSLGGKGLTKLSEDADCETVVLVLGSVDPVGGDERIGTIVAALNKSSGSQASPLVTAEAA